MKIDFTEFFNLAYSERAGDYWTFTLGCLFTLAGLALCLFYVLDLLKYSGKAEGKLTKSEPTFKTRRGQENAYENTYSYTVDGNRYTKKLKEGSPLDHRKDWRKGRRRFYGVRLLRILLIAFWVVLVFHMWDKDVTGSGKQERADYQGILPFTTMSDFAEGDYEENWKDLRYDYVIEWENALLNQGIKWAEHAAVHRPDGSVLQGGLHVIYYDAATEWMAKALAFEYLRVERARARENYEPLKCPDFGLDEAVAYRNLVHFPCVVLRKGNRVLCAYFYQTGPDGELTFTEWAGILADSLA